MQNSTHENNKRIAKNTLMLYFRMGMIMLVQLYTSRVVLNTLGVEDYGIYNVVAGVIVLFSFINGAMTTATQRFLNFELGRRDENQLARVFSMSVTVHLCLAAIIVLLGETIGLWFLNSQLNIPSHRLEAANWVYQFTIFSTCISVIQVPYNSTIIAHEKMKFYAYSGIIEVALKLLIVGLLVFIQYDKLIVYGILIFSVTLIIGLVIRYFCVKNFKSAAYKPSWEPVLFKNLVSFSGWSLFGSVATMSAGQGVNMLLNIFHGVTLNAAMGIATQVNAALHRFVSNFQIAYRPQIVKSFAANDLVYMKNLMFKSSRIAYLLLFALAAPIILNMEFILTIWLKLVPEYASVFCKLILVYSLLEALSAPLWMAIQATGKIKHYQLVISFAFSLNIFFSYILLKSGYSPTTILYVKIGVDILCLGIRLQFNRKLIQLSIKDFFKKVFFPMAFITIISLIPPMMITSFFNNWSHLFLTTILFGLAFVPSSFYIGFSRYERKKLIELISNRIRRRKHAT